jgi:hypothetical protein
VGINLIFVVQEMGLRRKRVSKISKNIKKKKIQISDTNDRCSVSLSLGKCKLKQPWKPFHTYPEMVLIRRKSVTSVT